MVKEIKKIMSGISPLYGICPFDKISGKLIPCRASVRIPEGAKSVIVACFPYLLKEDEYINSNVSKYAVVADYHKIVTDRLNIACKELSLLFPDEKFEPFADNSPIPEVTAACLAGLGKKGMNSLLITEGFGSYVFIGEIVTTLSPECGENAISPCIKCGKCLEACPAKALTAEGLETEKCLSYITQKKSELSEGEIRLMRECGCVWGCDICQDICPMNKNAAKTQIDEFLLSAVPFIESGASLDNRAYEWRGRKVIERNISVFNERS